MPLVLIQTSPPLISFRVVSMLSRVSVVVRCLLLDTLVQVVSLARVAMVVLARRTLRILEIARARGALTALLGVVVIVGYIVAKVSVTVYIVSSRW